MPRGKNTNVYLKCECGMQNYTTRINMRTLEGKLERNKYCSTCQKSTLHKSTKEIKHSS
ncbi:50S ribosomal protein L33 [Candidatus Peregrinibacteria bacterium]|nr:MAG: 50S ribosomal protein L33 [Candidatus Peregrinibacteria bacterium]